MSDFDFQSYHGMIFRNFKELNRFKELEKRMKQGLISDLYRNVKFEICPERYGNKNQYYFMVDISYNEGGKRIAEDARNAEERSTELYKLKKALFLANYPEFIFREI